MRSPAHRALLAPIAIGIAAGALLMAPLRASADQAGGPTDKQKEAAEKLFIEGRDALARGEHELACAKFRSSLVLASVASTLANVAQCDEREGHFLDAFNAWQRVLAMLPPGDVRIDAAKQRISALDQKVPKLTLSLPKELGAEATVVVDGARVDRATLGASLRLPPGEHTIVVGTPGEDEQRLKVTLAPGDRKEITIVIGKEAHKPPPLQTIPPPPPLPPPPNNTRRALGLTFAGAGLAGIIMAGVTGGLIISKDATIQRLCPNKVCSPEGRDAIESLPPLMVANAVGFVLGTVGVGGTAGILIASAFSPKPRSGKALFIVPLGAGAALGGVF